MPIEVILAKDGSRKSLPDGTTAMELATAISPGLAKATVVALVDGKTQDVRLPLKDGQKVELLKADSPQGLDTIRHSAEHILATAVCRLFPGTKVTMGPESHADEFYYDFDAARPFTPEDLEKIEAEMRKIIAEGGAFKMDIVSREEAFAMFDKAGQNNEYKREILGRIPEGERLTLYSNHEFVDLCRGPHVPDASIIKGVKLTGTAGAYWRADANNKQLQRVRGIAFPKKEDLDKYLLVLEEAKKRDHRKLGKELELFLVSERYDDHSYRVDHEVDVYVEAAAPPGIDSRIVDAVMDLVNKTFEGRTLRKTVKLSAPAADGASVDVRVRGFMSPEQRALIESIPKVVEGPATGTMVKVHVNVEPHYTEEVGPGLVLWLPKGGRLRTIIEEQWRKMHFEGGYEVVYSPHIAKADLWKTSGHWYFYREGMFSPMSVDGHDYVCKPMNCPFHIMMVKSRARSYREFPMRLAELGTVYRYELAGVMHGLMRVRGFTQDDAHLFCRRDQLESEIDRVIKFILRVLRTFGFSKFEVNLSTRPDKYVGAIEDWNWAEKLLEDAIKRHDLPYQVDPGGGAFYGPKIDIKLTDCLDRKWQCSTLQLDFNNPSQQAFGLEFTNSEGKKEQPVMLHRALLGSVERFIGILVEEYAGAFPGWLSPEQVRVITVSDKHVEYAQQVADELKAAGLRVDTDFSADKVGAKVREAFWVKKLPFVVAIGDKDIEAGGATLNIRATPKPEEKKLSRAELVAHLVKACAIPDVH
jgi:threonyl-tRNA synthetase